MTSVGWSPHRQVHPCTQPGNTAEKATGGHRQFLQINVMFLVETQKSIEYKKILGDEI